MPTHSTPSWDRARRQLVRRARAVTPKTPREDGMVALVLRNPDAIMARPADFLEVNAMLHEMERRGK